jgi:subtilisin family serine protease
VKLVGAVAAAALTVAVAGPAAASPAVPGAGTVAGPDGPVLDASLDAQDTHGVAAQRLAADEPPATVLTVEVGDPAQAAAVGVDVAGVVARVGGAVRSYDETLGQVAVEVPRSRVAAATASLEDVRGVAGVARPTPHSLDGSVDDTYYRTLQRGYLQPLGVETAWGRAKGTGAVIAVIDTGIDRTHKDLDSKVVGRYDAVYGGSYVVDEDGHGTLVASVAAAETNNKQGVAGVGYHAKLLVARVDDEYGLIWSDAVSRGIRWAADKGADVINLSLGSSIVTDDVVSAVAYAQSRGAVVVAAAGNEGTDDPRYPAALPGVIAVGATDGSSRAAFSSYGPWVDVAAPGVSIVGAVPGGYAIGDGTSFAAPIVAGQAALIRSKKQSLSVAGVRSAIVASATGIAADEGLGAGRVSIARSLDRVLGAKPTAPRTPSTTTTPARLTLRWTAPAESFRYGVDKYQVQIKRASSTSWKTVGYPKGSARALTVTKLANGVAYDLRVRAHNRLGWGPFASPVRAVVAQPSAVRDLTLTAGDGQVAVTWLAPASTGGSAITGYWVAYRPAGGATVTAKVTGAGTVLAGLANGTTYEVRVKAANRYTSGPWTAWQAATPAAPSSG